LHDGQARRPTLGGCSTQVVTNNIQSLVIAVVGDHFWSCSAHDIPGCVVLISHGLLTFHLPYSGEKVAANELGCPLSALRMADLIIGLSSRAGPVIVQSATRRTWVPSPFGAHV
jgi:hypothetical protein